MHILVDSTGLQVYGAGQWLEEKHGARSRRGWRTLHVALDADSSEIIAHTMTDQDAGDASQVEPLLNQIDGRIGQFTADGAYDGKPTYDAVTDHSPATVIVIPPRANAIEPAGGCMRRRSVRRRSRPPPWPRPFDDLPRATTESPLSLIGTATDTFGVGKRRIGFPNTPCWSAVTKAEGKLLF
ncbi:transposase [Sinorhizobium meliloti]|uniref:Probabable transposase n=1 Tax=Sinorhizobium meliloti (strain SM11) TaxID=707241 RepID=F7XBM6_SINMM|nr:probabable transposase [Sinorhizobium meliloti SM11]MBP2470748.1 transposase [Sinorhizobium meliloti]